MTFFGFISTGEILFALFVGLLLFGGRLPEVARDVGKAFYKLRRALQDMRRESGLDDAMRDIRREVEQASPKLPKVDIHAPLPAKSEPEAEVESQPIDSPISKADPKDSGKDAEKPAS